MHDRAELVPKIARHTGDGANMHDPASSEQWGEYLRRRRRQMGIRQHELASMAKVATRSVHALETGKETARIDILINVAAALGLKLTLSSPTSSVVLTPPNVAERPLTALPDERSP
jgi:HTH-type transcriptional regulator / antitoxin HipB